MSFHLPYFALRTSTAQIKDRRQDKGGEPLRRSYDVTFLDTKHEQLCAFLYEAQISVVISGTDEWRWVGYCFVDTYFDADHEDGESVDNYHQDSVGDDGMLVDPCTHGRLALDRPIQEPREYFLEVLRCRLHQVTCEWQQVVQNIKESIREHEQVCPQFISCASSCEIYRLWREACFSMTLVTEPQRLLLDYDK